MGSVGRVARRCSTIALALALLYGGVGESAEVETYAQEKIDRLTPHVIDDTAEMTQVTEERSKTMCACDCFVALNELH